MLTIPFKEGGPIFAACLACGVVAIVVFVERIIQLHRARIRFSDFLAGVFNILEKGKVREALAICDETAGPVARITHSAIMHRADSREDLQTAMENAGKAEIARMERRLRVISTIMHTAPLLGLLGCVCGGLAMVRSIQANQTLVQTLDLTSGLAEALQCTAAGLAVAIMAFAMFNIVVVRIDRIILDMDQAAADILAFIPTLGATASDGDAPSDEKAEK